MKKTFIIVTLFFISLLTFGQITDDFSDGDLMSNPVWTQDNPTNWVIADHKLQSNSQAANATFYITTPSTKSTEAQWEFSLNLKFNTSGANYVDVYLMSESAIPNSVTNNGYFVRIGGTPDEISLYKLVAGTSIVVIDGEDGITTSANNTLRIKVIRDVNNLWTLKRDVTGGTNYFTEGSEVDNTFLTGNFFGLLIKQSTASFFGKHFFDDLYIGDIIFDTTPPAIQSVQLLSDTELMIQYDETLNAGPAQEITNFSADNGIGNPSTATLQTDHKSIKLTFASPFPNGMENELTILNIEDEAGNAIIPVTQNFSFVTGVFNDIIINELFADASPQIGLPSQEFVEIFNRSNKTLDLTGWKLSDPTTIAALPSFQILPNDYVILTNSAGAISYAPSGKVIELSNFPTLNNDKDKIKLVNADGLKIDSVSYDLAWYQNEDKAEGGWTLERLNPVVSTNEATNWRASDDPSGGTPGKQNSVFGKNPDAKPPSLINLTVINNNELQLEFNEALSPNTTLAIHYATDNVEIGSPSLVTLSNDSKTVQLLFERSFANGVDFKLTISGIQDLAGNVMSEMQKSFRYFITAPSKRKDIVITELMVDPSPVVQLPEVEYLELFNRTNSPFDLKDWKISDATSTATLSTFVLLPNEYMILTSNTNISKLSVYGKVLGVSSFPSLNNDGESIVIRNSSGETIDSIYYSSKWYRDEIKSEGGWSLELFEPEDFSSSENNWIASQDEHGGTPGKQNSVFGKNPDTTIPELLNITVVTDHELVLEFSEPLSVSATQSSFYSVTDFGIPSAIFLLSDSSFVQLKFEKHFANGVDYNLGLSGITDRAGNSITDSQTPFRYFISTPSKFKDIIISEIMADPSPVVQLPEVEYIELFNRTAAPFDLKDWKLTDASGTTTLSSFTILPNEYVILTSTSNAYKFLSYGKVLGVSRFPSLNNEGEQVVLKNASDELIDSVQYSVGWYKDDDRSEGGWALELIDPENTCGEEGNWISGENERGGTPGQQNSVFANKPDLTGPKLVNATAESRTIILAFDEKLEKEISTSSFIISPDIPVSTVLFTNLSLREVQLSLTTPLASRTSYQIEIKNLRDCAGNFIQENFSRLTFALPEASDSLDIVFNEILFNPKPGGVDFVEIYNHSPKYLNLKNYKLANFEGNEVKNEKVITAGDLILPPDTYLVLTEDPVILKNNYPSGKEKNFYTTNLPSLSDDEGSVALLDDQNNVIDFLRYTEDYHSPLIKDDEGISLERISFIRPTNDPSNWRSANAMTGYATPGYLNSNARAEVAIENGEIEITPEIFSPTSGSDDFASIQYKFEQTGYIANVKIYDHQGRAIKEITNNEAIPEQGTFRWDGDRNDGTKARNGYYVVWFEVFDLSGKVTTYRKRVVLTSSN